MHLFAACSFWFVCISVVVPLSGLNTAVCTSFLSLWFSARQSVRKTSVLERRCVFTLETGYLRLSRVLPNLSPTTGPNISLQIPAWYDVEEVFRDLSQLCSSHHSPVFFGGGLCATKLRGSRRHSGVNVGFHFMAAKVQKKSAAN